MVNYEPSVYANGRQYRCGYAFRLTPLTSMCRATRWLPSQPKIVVKALGLDSFIPADLRRRPVFESFSEPIGEKKAPRFLVSAWFPTTCLLAPRPGLEPGTCGLTEGATPKFIVCKLKICKNFSTCYCPWPHTPNLCRTIMVGAEVLLRKVRKKSTS